MVLGSMSYYLNYFQFTITHDTYVISYSLVLQFTFLPCIIVTGPGTTGLIYTKYTCSYYGTYLLFCMCYPTSVSSIEFLMDFCTHDDILDTIWSTDKKLLHFKLSKSGQILRVDKTGFPRPGRNY